MSPRSSATVTCGCITMPVYFSILLIFRSSSVASRPGEHAILNYQKSASRIPKSSSMTRAVIVPMAEIPPPG